MVKSIRLLYRNIQGRVRCNYNWDWQKMCERSAVMVTAVEWSGGAGPGAVTFTRDSSPGHPHLGQANVYVTNIGPHDSEVGPGGVEFYLHADSDTPLDVLVTITDLGEVERTIMPKQ
ncbi:hypothetical protein [Massilia oculi]|uniref:hypothetical protein n=1 Tax=Massilia oculi TaxID=945844 RepID=UPI0028B0D0F9|nr:hypothetical protein [Massilia oculi]